MDRHNRRSSRIVGALAAAILYGAVLVFASSLSGASGAEATMPARQGTAAAAAGPAVLAQLAAPARPAAEDPLGTIAIVGISLGAAGLWRMRRLQLKRLANHRPATVPVRLQPVPERVTTIG